MLACRFRFHGHSSLQFLYRFGRTYRNKWLLIRVARNPKRVHNRYAVVIAKKVIKSAPKRNRVRRRIYEILRKNADGMLSGYDTVVTVNSPEVLAAPHEELEKLLLDTLYQADVYRS